MLYHTITYHTIEYHILQLIIVIEDLLYFYHFTLLV